MMHFMLIWFALYWLPTIIALVRHAPAAPGIALVNFFFGWTGIGWIVALVWALSSAPRPQVIVHLDGGRTIISR
jgi:hypothetical protein